MAFLSDSNSALIDAYNFIRDRAELVAGYLARMAAQDSEPFYYRTRAAYNKALRSKRLSSATQAARFIYLNRTCFNGIFRVNQRGQFNVPYGHKVKAWFPKRIELENISNALSQAKVFSEDYRASLEGIPRGSFIYLDPPYPPLNGTSYFNHYTSGRFSDADQHELAAIVRGLDRDGCLVMLSNADTEAMRALYRGFKIRSLPVTRWVTCKKEKHIVRELVVTNY